MEALGSPGARSASNWSMFDSVRKRLTLWYAGVLALSLIALALFVYYAAAATFYQRQDESLLSTAQTVASAYREEVEEQQSRVKADEVVLRELVFPDRYIEFTDTKGQAIARSEDFPGDRSSLPSDLVKTVRQRRSGFATINSLRIAVVPLSPTEEQGFAVAAEPVKVIDDGLRRLRRHFFAGVPLILLLVSVGGYFLGQKSLSPIASMNLQTQHITAENLSSRLAVPNPRDELGRLATTINELLRRLETSFNEQQRFLADASHELRTPLAVLRGETEVSLSKRRTVEEYQESLALIRDEAERLSRIVEDLFILARQPISGPANLMIRPLSLNEVVSDCVRAAQVLAGAKGLRLKVDLGYSAVSLSGDEELLKRMLLNLLDNAVKYTPSGGEIFITLAQLNGNAQIIVRDTGIGIPQADQSRVFDRFYRVDKARSRALGGAGLGLSIVRSIVEAHGGKVQIDSLPGRGSQFTVELPMNVDSER